MSQSLAYSESVCLRYYKSVSTSHYIFYCFYGCIMIFNPPLAQLPLATRQYLTIIPLYCGSEVKVFLRSTATCRQQRKRWDVEIMCTDREMSPDPDLSGEVTWDVQKRCRRAEICGGHASIHSAEKHLCV